jgi:predicted metalloprotease with PDZ domain
VKTLTLIAALLAAALQPVFPAAVAAEAPPASPAQPVAPAAPTVPAAPAAPAANAELEAQLETARRKLEEAAHEVAALSAQMSGTLIEQVMPYVGVGRAIIGVQLDNTPQGARVSEVSPGGPAAEAGIRAGDVIVAVDGSEVGGPEAARKVVRIMRNIKPDSRVSVRVLREGRPREFVVTARPGPTLLTMHGLSELGMPPADLAFVLRRPFADMELASLTPRLGSYFGADKGILVVRAPADGALQLQDGDVILAIDGRVPSSGAHATRILGSYQPGEKVSLRILRQHKTLDLESVLPERADHTGMMQRDGPLPEPASPHRTAIFGNGDI